MHWLTVGREIHGVVHMKRKLHRVIEKLGNRIRDSLIPASRAASEANAILLMKHLKYTYGDQKGQVDFLINNVFDYENNGLLKSGFFVDLACSDGMNINNTYFLEKHLNWTGLLFEPNPCYKENIDKHRTSKLITNCVTDKAGDTVRFRIDNGMLGGIVSEETDNSEAVRGSELNHAEIIDVPTTTLELELKEVNAPSLIDFLSLDIEGAEWIAMKEFPFDRYKFRCMAIERPNESLDLLLEENGYRQAAHLTDDVIFVHKDFLAEVNFDPKVRFAFTPRKDW